LRKEIERDCPYNGLCQKIKLSKISEGPNSHSDFSGQAWRNRENARNLKSEDGSFD
jgi:hypothetical protein